MKPIGPDAAIETKALHAGYTPENGGPRVLPIVQSTTYAFDSSEHIAALFDMPTEYMYSRFANPTCDAVEKKIAAMEGGVGAMLTSSGQAASLLSVLNLAKSGESIVAASAIYGGTINLFGFTLKKLGIECIWVSSDATEEEIRAAIKPSREKTVTVSSYFADYVTAQVRADLMDEYNISYDEASKMLRTGGLRVYSTIDTRIQKIADDAFADHAAAFLVAETGEDGLEEEDAEDGEKDKKLEQDEPDQRPSPGHVPEAVAVKMPYRGRRILEAFHILKNNKLFVYLQKPDCS